MASVRTLNQFQDALDREMGWRVKEIGVFNVASKNNGPNNKAFIRAGVALTYAHWEGFIKGSSEIYLEYVRYKNLTYRDLKTCFAVFGLKGRLNALVQSKSPVSNIEAFDFIIEHMDSVAQFSAASSINTQSNLSSVVFASIASSLAIDTNPYNTRFNLIDKSLVDRRNAIAHGEHLTLSGLEFGVLVSEILDLMRQYKTDLQNAATLETFKRAAA
jgi:hypothetical protein